MDKLQVPKFDAKNDFPVWRVQKRAYLEANSWFGTMDGTVVTTAHQIRSSAKFEYVIRLEDEKRRLECSFDQRLELFRRFLAWEPRELTL